MLSKEEEYELFKNNYLQQPISMLTEENLDKLKNHCEKTIHITNGRAREEHLIVLEVIDRYYQQQGQINGLKEKLEKDIKHFMREIKLRPTENNSTIGACGYASEILKIVKGEKKNV